jgi:hypothetical protein
MRDFYSERRNAKMKLKIRQFSEKEDPSLELWLERCLGNTLILKAKCENDSAITSEYALLFISEEGFEPIAGIPDNLGFKVDKDDKICVIND